MYKQCTLPNDERLFRGSNVHETDINGCQKMAFVEHYAGLCGTGVTRSLSLRQVQCYFLSFSK